MSSLWAICFFSHLSCRSSFLSVCTEEKILVNVHFSALSSTADELCPLGTETHRSLHLQSLSRCSSQFVQRHCVFSRIPGFESPVQPSNSNQHFFNSALKYLSGGFEPACPTITYVSMKKTMKVLNLFNKLGNPKCSEWKCASQGCFMSSGKANKSLHWDQHREKLWNCVS